MTRPIPTSTTTDILVVGAGPAGLATAVSALRHGAGVLVVDRRAGTSTVPRATGVSVRTMELLRFWGLADAVRAGSVDCDPWVTVTQTLAAEPDEIVSGRFPSVREALRVSPAVPAVCAQDHIEPLLVDEVRRLGGEVRFASPFTGLRTTADGVRAELGTGARVRARFLVGADGRRSGVRDALGIGWEHLGTMGEFAQVLFRPDLAALLGRRPPIVCFVEHPDATGVLFPVGHGRWCYVRERDDTALTPARWTALLRTAAGLPDLQPEFLGESAYAMAADVAATFRAGPGFLVGDAAHRMTPAAGNGMNTAVHDGHELGWRLAWVVRGLADEPLLDSWTSEREPIGRAMAARSLRVGPDPSDGLITDLGRTYRSAAVVDDGEPPADGHDRAARPGERAPHVWVRRQGRRIWVLDLFDGRLTVLAGPDGGAWVYAARRLAGLPVDGYVAGQDLIDDRDALVRGYRLGARSAVLVRPDGFVAWRHDGPCPDPAAALAAAVATVLGTAAHGRAVAS